MKLSPVVLMLFFSMLAFAQMPVREIPRLNSPIEFDGKVSPGEWSRIDSLPMVGHWPTYSEKPNARTILRVTFDDNYFYFSAVCYDKPNHIQQPTFERDNWEMTMDQVAIILDTYNDNENGVIFVVTPTGSRIDVSLKNDAQGESPVDLSWNSFWEARVSKDDTGWAVEARVPFSSLRFQTSEGNVTMGMIAYRYLARERQMDIFPNIPPNWGFWSFIKPSKAQEVLFSNVHNKRPWFISPYALAATGYHHLKPEQTTYPDKISDNRAAAGLDIQHALTDNMNVDITVNTDFAQVEADDQIVNLTRFSYYFPEKRRFFLERSSIMDFGFDDNNRLFYSRRIGIEGGQISPLKGGVRLVGRINKYDVGFLNIQSRKNENPSENFGVLRLRRRVSKNNSYIGGILTSRTDWKGANNFAYGLDGIINLFDDDYLKLNFAATSDSQDTLTYSNFINSRKRIYIMWENRSQVGFNYSLSYSQVDKSYAPGIGFELRNNYKAIGERLSYGWFIRNSKTLRYINLDLLGTAYFSNSNNRVESFLVSPKGYLEWKKNSYLTMAFNRYYDNVPSAFNLSDQIQIPAKAYINKDVSVTYQTPSVNFLNTNINVALGSFYDGQRLSGAITPTYVLSKYITLSGSYQYNHIYFHGSTSTYTTHVGRLKVSSSLNVHLNVNAFFQINSLTNLSTINFRLRYNWKDGNDLYLVYNEALNNEGKESPLTPFTEYRYLGMKYTYTFHLGR